MTRKRPPYGGHLPTLTQSRLDAAVKPMTTHRPARAAAAAICAAVSLTILIAGCSSTPDSGGSPFKSGQSSTSPSTGPVATGPVTGVSTAGGSAGSIDPATVTVTSTATADTQPTTGVQSITQPTTRPSNTSLNYATTITAPPTPIGAAGTQTSSTETMRTVTPSAMAKPSYPAITAPTRLPRPQDTARTDPVQLSAAFVSLMEGPSSTDSMADNATLRAGVFATDALRAQLSAQITVAASARPAVGYVQVTIKSAAIISANTAAKTVTVAVIYKSLTIISASSNYNEQSFLLRMCTLQKGSDGKWLLSVYRIGPN